MEKDDSKNYNAFIWYGLCCGGLVIVIGCGTYIYQFWHHTISDNPEQWGQLGDYMNFFVSIASLIIVGVLTYTIHKIEQKRGEYQEIERAKKEEEQTKFQQELQKQRENFEYALERPTLIFKVDVKDGNKWKVANIGRGPALNLLVAHTVDGISWIQAVKCYSLQSGESTGLEWQQAAHKWRVRYSDIFGNVYSATCEEDETIIQQGDGLASIPKDQHQRLDEILKANAPNRVFM